MSVPKNSSQPQDVLAAPPVQWALWLGLLFALALNACSAALPTDPQIQDATPASLQSIETGLRNAAKASPDNPRVLLLLARALLKRGALVEAEQVALRADQLAPAQGVILGVLAEIYLAQDKRFRALTTASQAIQFDPNLLSAYVTAARANALLGEPDKAFRVLDEALRREPRYFSAWYYRARVLYDIGAVRDAEVNLYEALRVQPLAKEALLLQIRIVKREGRLASAAYLIQTALKSFPEDIDLLQELLDLYRQRQDWASAGQVLEQLQKLGPLTPEAGLTRLEVLRAQGLQQLFRDGLSALLVSNPRFSPALVLQAQTLLGASRPEEAIPSLTRAVDLDPGSVEARFWLAVAYYQNGEVLQGNTAMAEMTRLAPEYPPLRLLRIRRQLVEHRLEAVPPLLDDFLRDYPNDVEALLLKSEWLALAGDYSGSNAILAALPPVWNQRVLAFNRARLAYLQGQYRSVVEFTEPLMGEPVASWRAAYLRAAALARLGQYKDSLALLIPYLRLAEGDGRFHRLMGDVFLMSGDRNSAERAYQDGLSSFPRKPLLVDGLSHLAIMNQNWALARDQLERGLEQPGEYRTVFLERLTLVYQRLNEPQESRRVQDEYLAAADPVLREALHPSEQGLLFSMSSPPLEPIFRAASSARVPPPPVPITRAADALSSDAGLRGLPVAPPLR